MFQQPEDTRGCGRVAAATGLKFAHDCVADLCQDNILDAGGTIKNRRIDEDGDRAYVAFFEGGAQRTNDEWYLGCHSSDHSFYRYKMGAKWDNDRLEHRPQVTLFTRERGRAAIAFIEGSNTHCMLGAYKTGYMYGKYNTQEGLIHYKRKHEGGDDDTGGASSSQRPCLNVSFESQFND